MEKLNRPATLDDYAYLLWGILELYAATYNPYWMKEALSLSQKMSLLFSDKEGGLYLSGNDIDDLPMRQKNYRDSVLPSGNSIAALSFIKISLITGNHDIFLIRQIISLRLPGA